MIHDVEHTGTTNNFHICTRLLLGPPPIAVSTYQETFMNLNLTLFCPIWASLDKPSPPPWYVLCSSAMTIMYNDRSVLENHHISTAYRYFEQSDCNPFDKLSKDDFRYKLQCSSQTSGRSKLIAKLKVQIHKVCRKTCSNIMCCQQGNARNCSGSSPWNGHVCSLHPDKEHAKRSLQSLCVSFMSGLESIPSLLVIYPLSLLLLNDFAYCGWFNEWSLQVTQAKWRPILQIYIL